MTNTVVTCPGCGARNRVPAAAAGLPRCPQCKGPLPWIASADDFSFAEVADSSRVAVLLDLWAPWCGPCRQISPALEKIAGEMAGRLKLVKINVDDNPQLATRFRAQSIPLLVLLKDGKEADRRVGALPPVALRSWLSGAI